MFRFISGVLAWISARTATAASKEDTGLVDWLESRCGDSPVVLRWSSTGRGWRLHDCPGGSIAGTILGGPVGTVREAIHEAMLSAAWDGGSYYDDLASRITDSQMLDWLDCLSGRYTGRVVWRRSTTRPGWILHETSRRDAVSSVREAINGAIRLDK
jgi:hypothetical protein